MRNFRLTFIILATVFASFGIIQIGRALQNFHRNYFWTPTIHQEPLEKGKDTFEIYVRGKAAEHQTSGRGTRSQEMANPGRRSSKVT